MERLWEGVYCLTCMVFIITLPSTALSALEGGRAHYIIESKVQWKPFRLATQQYPQNDWLGGNFPHTMTYAHGPHWVKLFIIRSRLWSGYCGNQITRTASISFSPACFVSERDTLSLTKQNEANVVERSLREVPTFMSNTQLTSGQSSFICRTEGNIQSGSNWSQVSTDNVVLSRVFCISGVHRACSINWQERLFFTAIKPERVTREQCIKVISCLTPVVKQASYMGRWCERFTDR